MSAEQSRRALLEQALSAIDDLQARLEVAERAQREPVAIVGMGCRYPGGVIDLASYWRVLEQGVDAVTEVPATRWNVDEYLDPDPAAPGRMSIRFGGFLDRVDEFDAGFFGIAPREAATIDPQQRLVLEVAWEALEVAGCAPDRLVGSPTGVFLGITANDYGQVLKNAGEMNDIYVATGNTLNAAAGRLAFTLGLQGPCMSVDTACSSSLVAVHLACQSLRSGESSLAIAGGVNAMLVPDWFVLFGKWGMIAPDGRCKTFDRAADGFVRGEGCGMVVLKRLSDAIADGDRVFGVIRGSAVNQDGRSSGLTVPNGVAQQQLLRQALSNAGLTPGAVDYVEAHGTGTSLGDPIEVEALGEVFREGREQERPLLIGSVKTNFGHTESASGIAGLLKVVLALGHQAIPAHLHFNTPNPRIAWDSLPLAVPTALTPWPAGPRKRIAGVSSFGVSGTNAHVIVEEAPHAKVEDRSAERPFHILTLSAKSPAALLALAGKYAETLTSAEAEIGDVCFTANTGRASFPHRLAVAGASAQAIGQKLAVMSSDLSAAGANCAEVSSFSRQKIAFLFTGQGSQYNGMARQLFETQPVFRRALEQCADVLSGELDRPLLDVLYPPAGSPTSLDETAYTQPALFSVEYALAELWRSWGIEPSAVLGHSVGEYVAACVAGIMGVDDALRLIATRGRLMQSLPKGGAMAAVAASEREVAATIARISPRVSIAAVNAPDQVVVSGAHQDVAAVVAAFDARGVLAQGLPVSHAFHSALVEPVLDRFEAAAARIQFGRPTIPIVSNLTGELVRNDLLSNAAYWRRHAREAVRFSRGVEALYGAGHRIFLEVGPRPALLGAARRSVGDDQGIWLATLRPPRTDWEQILESLSQLFLQGIPIDWAGFDAGYLRAKVVLPTYPFQRQRCWVMTSSESARRVPARAKTRPLYTIDWRPIQLTAQAQASRAFLVVGDDSEAREQISSRLASAGARVISQDVRSGHDGSPVDVVFVAGLSRSVADAASLQADAVEACGRLLDLVQSITSGSPRAACRLRVVTRGAFAAGNVPVNLVQAPIAGVARVVMAEHPELECSIVDLDDADASVDALVKELLAGTSAEQVALREGSRSVARLVPGPLPTEAAPNIRSDVSYLITGGLGVLGLTVARWLVDRGARSIVLTGRRAASGKSLDAIAALEASGARLRVVTADVSRKDDVARLLSEMSRDLPPLAGVVHAAGVIDDGVIAHQTRERFDRVFAAKVAGAWNLHAQTRDLPLDFFVLFASIAGVLGSPGQSNYAAANAFLDALAFERTREGLAALSIDWGPWAEGGMAAGVADSDRRRWSASGVELMSSATALDILGALIAVRTPQAVVLPVRDEDFKAAARNTPFLCEMAGTDQRRSMPRPAAPDLLQELSAVKPARRRSVLRAHLLELTSSVLGLDAREPFDARRGFRDLGMDSLMAVDLRNRLQLRIKRSLPSTLAFDQPNLDALTRYLADEVLDLAGEEAEAAGDRIDGPWEFADALASVEELSDEEVDRLLAQRLGAGSVLA